MFQKLTYAPTPATLPASWHVKQLGTSAVNVMVNHTRAPFISVRTWKSNSPEESNTTKRLVGLAVGAWLSGQEQLHIAFKRAGPDRCESECGVRLVATAPRILIADSETSEEDKSADARIDNGLIIEAIVRRDLRILPEWGRIQVPRG